MGLCYNPFVRDLFERSIRPVSEEGCSLARRRRAEGRLSPT